MSHKVPFLVFETEFPLTLEFEVSARLVDQESPGTCLSVYTATRAEVTD